MGTIEFLILAGVVISTSVLLYAGMLLCFCGPFQAATKLFIYRLILIIGILWGLAILTGIIGSRFF